MLPYYEETLFVKDRTGSRIFLAVKYTQEVTLKRDLLIAKTNGCTKLCFHQQQKWGKFQKETHSWTYMADTSRGENALYFQFKIPSSERDKGLDLPFQITN